MDTGIKKNYITLLSVISAISVVILHSNGCFWQFSTDRYWFTANIIESLFYFAVPVFFMITGANLIDYKDRYSTKVYFEKRIKKVLIPFLCWSVIGILYCLFVTKTISIHSIDIKYIFNGILNTSFIRIYWFFIPLLCVYLCIPLFASVEKKYRKQTFSYLIIAGFILNILIPFVIQLFNLDIAFPLELSVCSGYLLYVLIGYILNNYEVSKKMRYIIYLFGMLGLLVHIIGTYKLSIDAGKIIKIFKEYNNVPCMFYSISIFCFVKEVSSKIKNYKLVNFLGGYTFPIYLMHYYSLSIIQKIFNIPITSIFYRLGVPFIVILICILATIIIRKIPILRKILP